MIPALASDRNFGGSGRSGRAGTGGVDTPSTVAADLDAGSVLVVEDDQDIVDELAETLRENGYRVVTAKNGRDALEKLSLWRPSIVVLDLMMPVMSGWDLLATMRGDLSLARIPVVIITAAKHATRAIGLGPVFVKPLNVESLLRAVRTYAVRGQ